MPAPARISFKLTAEQAQAPLDALRQIAGEDHFKHRAEVRAFYAASDGAAPRFAPRWKRSPTNSVDRMRAPQT